MTSILDFFNKPRLEKKLAELENNGRTNITNLDINDRVRLVAMYKKKHPDKKLDYIHEIKNRERVRTWLVVKE